MAVLLLEMIPRLLDSLTLNSNAHNCLAIAYSERERYPGYYFGGRYWLGIDRRKRGILLDYGLLHCLTLLGNIPNIMSGRIR